MRYGKKFDWFLLASGILFGALNGVISPFVLVINLRLINALLVGQAEYEAGGINIDTFTSGMVEACLLYLAVAVAMFIAGFIGVSNLILLLIIPMFQTLSMCTLSHRQVRVIQQKFLLHVLNQDIAWLDQNQIGALTEKASA
jgi:hypothetical protein